MRRHKSVRRQTPPRGHYNDTQSQAANLLAYMIMGTYIVRNLTESARPILCALTVKGIGTSVVGFLGRLVFYEIVLREVAFLIHAKTSILAFDNITNRCPNKPYPYEGRNQSSPHRQFSYGGTISLERDQQNNGNLC